MIRALFLVLLLAGCGGGGGSDVTPAPAPTARTVEINADSIYAGVGLAERPVVQLARLRPDWKIIDKAVSGLSLHSLTTGYQTPFDGAPVSAIGPQAPFAALDHPAEIVLISFGINDAYSGSDKPAYNAERFEAELRGAIAAIRAQGRVPLLTGVVPLLVQGPIDAGTVARAAQFNEVVIRLSTELSVPNARWDTVEFNGLPDTVDGLHRTQAAVDRLTLRLAQSIDAIPRQPASAGFSLPEAK